MINVSNDFKKRMEESRNFKDYAQVTFADGSEITLDSDQFVPTNSALSDGDDTGFPIGVAVQKNVQLEIINDDQQYADKDFLGAKIRLYTDFQLDEVDPFGSINLFAIKNSVDGYLSDSNDGTINSNHNNGECTSDYIEVSPGDVLTIQTWATAVNTTANYYMIDYMWFSDKSAESYIGRKTFTRGGQPGFNHATVKTAPVPDTAKYIRVSTRLYKDGKIKVEKGDIATEYSLAPEDIRTERIEKGTYTVITPETYGETVIITAYDDMYKADKDYTTALTFPQTAGAVLRDICDTCGISLGSTSFLHDDFQIQNKPTGKFREVIGQIAMIACGNARIDCRNYLQIMPYNFEWGYNANVVAGENLFIDKNSIRGWINNSGTVTVQDPYRATDYISVSEGDILIFQLWRPDSASTWWGRTFFDKDKAFVQGTYTSTYITTDHIVEKIVIPQGVSFVRVSYAFASGFKIKIEKGNTATAYIPNVADDVNPYMLLDEFTAPKIEYNDTVITGFKTIIKGETSEDDKEILQGTDTYCITVENPLISGQEQTVLSWLLERIGNVPFRPFSGDAISNPLVEFMDLAKVKDRRGNEYNTFVTDVNFLMPGYTTLKNSTPSATRSAIAYTSNSARFEQRARQLVELEKNARELAVERLSEALANGSGLYPTEERQPDGSTIYYLHDKPTRAESKVVIKLTSEGIGISQNGGSDYPWGITFTGEAILKLIYAVGINCDYLTTGAITVKDDKGNIIFQVDMDTKSVTISGDHVRIGGKSATTAISDSLTEAKNYSDGKLSDYANTVSKSISGLQEQIDGQIETFYYDYEPSLQNVPASAWTSETERQKHQGDLFYNKKTGYAYRFFKDGSTWKWQLIQDTDITKAMQTAETAKDTADNKRRVFVVTPQPPYDIGDLWTNGTDVLTCAVARAQGAAYVSTDWQKLNKYTDDTIANQALEEARKSTNLTIILDNEYQGISTDSTGKYSGTLSVSTIVQTYYGHQNVSSTCTYTFQKSDGVTYTWDGATRKCTITALTTDTGWVDITASYMSLFTVTKRFNVAKVRAGAVGDSGINRILNSNFSSNSANWTNWGSPTTREIISKDGKNWAHIVSSKVSFQGYQQNNGLSLEKNTSYTFSVLAYGANDEQHFTAGIHFLSTAGTIIKQLWNNNIILSTTPKRYTLTFVTPNNDTFSHINLMVGVNNTTAIYNVYFTEIKVEKGTKASDWTPAPQDLVGPAGKDGTNGTNGTSSYTHIRYSANADGSSMTATPSANTPYIGVYTGTSASAPSDYKAYTWSKYKGDKGDTGAKGATGNGINTITYYYAVTNSATPPAPANVTQTNLSTAISSMTATNRYLWQKEVIDFTNTSVADKTTVTLIAVYGNTGATGAAGKDGAAGAAGKDGTSVTITATSIQYQASTNGQTAPSTWSNTIPSVPLGQYLWTKTEVTYSNGTKTTAYSVAYKGTNGTNGKDGAAGRTYFMEPSTLIVKRSANNAMAPNYITLSAYYRDGTSTARTAYAGRFKIEESLDGDKWTTVYTSTANEATVTHSLYGALATSEGGAISSAANKTIGIPRDVVAIRCTLYAAGGTTQMLDMQTVAVVIDVDALTHEEIFNLLTNNGAINGIYQEGNQLYINATYIATGKIASKNGKVYFDLENNEMSCDRLKSSKPFFSTTGSDPQEIFIDIGYTAKTSSSYYSQAQIYRNGYKNNGVNIDPYPATSGSGSTSYNEIYAIGAPIDIKSAASRTVSAREAFLNLDQYSPSKVPTAMFGVKASGSSSLQTITITPTDTIIGGTNIQMGSGNSSVTVSGTFSIKGSKSRIADTKNYGDRLLYCYEMPSPMFGDIGEAVTDENGKCYVYLDDVFSETVSAQIEYQVFLQKEGPGDVWIVEKTPQYFVVKGTENLKFAWEVKAKQKDYEYERLDTVEKLENIIQYELDIIATLGAEYEEYIKKQEEILYETA